MKPKTYMILQRAVEEGTIIGLARAFKHNDTPSTDQVVEAVHSAVMDEICELFDFPPADYDFIQ